MAHFITLIMKFFCFILMQVKCWENTRLHTHTLLFGRQVKYICVTGLQLLMSNYTYTKVHPYIICLWELHCIHM